VHLGLKPHVCTECGDTFADSGKLGRHTTTVHVDAAAAFVCAVCGLAFASDHIRRVHAATAHAAVEAPAGGRGGAQ